MSRLGSSTALSFGLMIASSVVLYVAKPVLLPLATALLLTVVVAPAVSRLERVGIGRLRVGRVAAVLVVALATSGLFVGTGWILVAQGEELVEKLPEYRRVALRRIREPLASLRRLERTAREVREMTDPAGGAPRPAQVEVVEGNSELVSLARDWAGSLASVAGTAGLVIVLLGFLLLEREKLRDRLIRVVARGDLHTTTTAFAEAADRVTAYVRALALVNLGHGVLVAAGLFAVGLPGALLFGLLSALLRFVPYLGPWIAASLPIGLALVTGESWSLPLAVAGFFVALELFSNNVLEPWVIGRRVGLSPFAVIAASIFWAWLWGPLGLVLSVPITATLVVLGRYAPSLEPLSTLLSDTVALPPVDRLYHRLLAHDLFEATALVRETSDARGALVAWDELVLPALRRLERDRRAGRLEPEQLDVVSETLELLASDLPEREPAPARDAAEALLLCVPARSRWDVLVCAALTHVLGGRGTIAQPMEEPSSALAEALEGKRRVLISSLAGRTGAAQHLALRIRRLAPKLEIAIGDWGETTSDGVHGVGPLDEAIGGFAPALCWLEETAPAPSGNSRSAAAAAPGDSIRGAG